MGKFHLQLRVIEATNIPAADLGGYSDPYCSIQVGYEYHWSHKVHKTRVIGKSLHPVWNEVFALEADNPDKDRVRIIVYDHDMIGKDDALGEANINLAGLFAGVEQDLWLPLTQAGKGRGNLHVTVKALDFGKPGGVQQVTTVTQTGGYPAPGAPAPGGYPPQPGYGAPAPAPGGYPPQPGYGAPAPGGYPPQPGYGAPAPGGYPPQPGYGAPAPGGYPPQPGYGAPAPGGYPPQPGYGAPAPGGYPPQPGYGAPAPGYGVQQTTVTTHGYAAPAPAYGYAPAPAVVVHRGKPKKYKYKMKLGKALGFKKFKW